ncbi:hypothetical protein FJZ39_01525 [Candidatus Saccharibacteria bacterium]|nr:hypothetical protein [Candidatus Saccharibacteria bacterium]
MNTTYLSKRGYKELQKEVTQLERELHQITATLHNLDKGTSREERLERNEALGQFENTEYELREKNRLLAQAKLYPGKRDRIKVALGSVVDLIDQQGRLVQYTLVDSIEANPSDGRISIHSPLGQTLLGRTLKDTIEWSTRHYKSQMQLVAIS